MIQTLKRWFGPGLATATIACIAAASAAEPNDAAMLDVFPASPFTAPERGKTVISSEFTPSVGPWGPGLDERKVFGVSMKHDQGPMNSYELRIGVGGQVYSLHGPFGESVPPSYRRPGATPSPWNDEVWQAVAVCSRFNRSARELPWLAAAGPYKTSYFIHNSGCYGDAPDLGLTQVYCPRLASHTMPGARLHRQVNWGMVPQMRTIHRSPILFYTQVRDVGDGVIELTWVVHNFSVRDDVVFNYFNTPWGGMRVSSLPQHYVGMPDGSLELDDIDAQRFAEAVPARTTGGFALSSTGPGDDAAALALVFGRDGEQRPKGQRPLRYRAWLASAPNYKNQWKDFATRPANSFRNYMVVVSNPQPTLRPGQTMWFRSYLVVGTKARCRELAAGLVQHAGMGVRRWEPADARLIDAGGFGLFARPVAGSMPVFAIRHKPTGKTVYTTDPYRFIPQQPLKIEPPADHPDAAYYRDAVGYTIDGKSEYLGLLGFAPTEKPTDAGWLRMSEAAGDRASGSKSVHDVDVWVRHSDKP